MGHGINSAAVNKTLIAGLSEVLKSFLTLVTVNWCRK